MSTIDEIRKPVAKEMELFESFFNNTMKSQIPMLRLVLNYLLRRKGKQMRPLLVLLSAGINGQISESTYVAATLIELLHTASLVHDDVVDDSDERRGALSVNALWNSKIAVLVGDYMLAQGLLVSVQKSRYDMLEVVSKSVQAMTEAELLQIQKIRKFNISEDEYFRIISGKTAALISACTTTGTISATNDISRIEKMRSLGLNIGIAFQIRDDLLDYSQQTIAGKKPANDIKEGKVTLPLIYSLEQSSQVQKHKIISLIKKKVKNNDDIKQIIRFVEENGGIDYSKAKMLEYGSMALSSLETFPGSEYRDAMKSLIEYTTSRDK